MVENYANTNPSVAKIDLKGLDLAEHHFGPLLHPTPATQSAWTNYSINRLQTNQKYRTVVPVPGKGCEDGPKEGPSVDKNVDCSGESWLFDNAKACVSQIEKELDLEHGTLQKCITVVYNETVLESEFDPDTPRSTDHTVRIYSPTAPMCIDVHFQYYLRSRFTSVQWFYSLGYKIHRHPPATAGDALVIKKELKKVLQPDVHTRNGWQNICWGYYDDSGGNTGENWRAVERGKVELYEEGVLDVHEALFGELEKPAETDPEAMLTYQRSLVRSIRLLLAAVGISYGVACTDDESDSQPPHLTLEGLHDKWVGRGIRNACGLRLARDAEEERDGAFERRDFAKGDDDDFDFDEDGDDNSDYGF